MHKKNIEQKNLYDAWTGKCHDACSNVVKLSSNLVQVHKIGLSIEFLTKKPQKFEKPNRPQTEWPLVIEIN